MKNIVILKQGRRAVSASLALLLAVSLVSTFPGLMANAAEPPVVATGAATNVTTSSATLNGELTSLGSATEVAVFFDYGTAPTYGTSTPFKVMSAAGSFSANITGLNPGTTYYFRARANGGASGAASGNAMTFTTTTPPAPPSVTTGEASNITADAATLNGNLTALGAAAAVKVSFEYGPTAVYGSTTPPQEKNAAGAFSAALSGLSPNTLYHFRAKADGGDKGVSYGESLTFTTKAAATAAPPTVVTGTASNVTVNSATLNGNLTALGAATTVKVSFEYGPTTTYGSATQPGEKTAAGTFTTSITGLTSSATYHFRAKADGGDKGVAYGNDAVFTTIGNAPSVTTNPATAVSTIEATLNGTLVSLGLAQAVNVSFEYGATDSYGTATKPEAKTAAGDFSAVISELKPDTTYHFRAKADGGDKGVGFGKNMTFTTQKLAPTVNTSPATEITASEAALNGSLISLGGSDQVSVSFEYGSTDKYGLTTQKIARSAAGDFSLKVSGLKSSTTYHYRAKAEGGDRGTGYGSDVTFATTGAKPEVTTGAATGVTINSAVLNGNLTSPGAAAAVNASFEYGTTDKYGQATKAEELKASGSFSATLSGLGPNTTYHFRAKADGGDKGVGYGADATFTTLSTAPAVATRPASNISFNTVTLNGNLSSLGLAAKATVSFEYGPDTKYGTATKPEEKTAGGEFSVNIAGLAANTVYHFRARADGGERGVAYGADATFTTLDTMPAVETAAATEVTEKSATLNGNLKSLGAAVKVSVSFEYGPDTRYGTATKPEEKTAGGAFSAKVTGLTPGVYHYRAKAAGGDMGAASGTDMGIAYGADMTFTAARNIPGNFKVVYTTEKNGKWQVSIVNSDGSNGKALGNPGGYVEGAVLSPDGTRIAYHGTAGKDTAIFVMSVDGAGAAQLTDLKGLEASWPAWSPNGKLIAFGAGKEDQSDIYIINIDGSGLKKLTDGKGWNETPSWSPDGKLIAFASDRESPGKSDIYVMNADGSGLKRLTGDPGTDVWPTWSPDGKLIAFTSDRAGKWSVYLMTPDGKETKRLEDGFRPVWLADGSAVVYTAPDNGKYVLQAITDDGSGRRKLAEKQG
ncbi:MAG: hypothetical protein AB1597_09415 [Chloroflexota bacterium]